MNLRVSLLNIFLPYKLKEETMLALFETTAGAFQMAPPVLDGLRFHDILRTYATFTRAAAMRQIGKKEDVSHVKKRLYDGAFQLGEKIRSELRIHSRRDALKAARLLYRAIGIDFYCSKSGEVIIQRCYFSNFYPCEVCWIISSLDEGIVAGLTDGGRLWFVSRITEGNDSCVGEIEFEK
jgi:predicted RNA-binding Zn-ribbon protein involved in translation (DUF1610 family)